MEVEAQTHNSHSAVARSPESLRQRQRDRMSPRGRFTKANTSPTISEFERPPQYGIALSSAPKPKVTGKRVPDSQKTQMQEGARKDNGFYRRDRKDAEDMKSGITPDGGSAGREGRQFTVAKVGNNGKIYLRPTIRPANQRYPQPEFVFPTTPPDTGGLDAATFRNEEEDQKQRDSLWTPFKSPSILTNRDQYFDHTSPTKPQHRRARSYSTVDEQHAPVTDADEGAFKVVIERPGTGAKKADYFRGTPTLDVPIPSYKLGNPRFSMRGTPILRGSSYTATNDEGRSSTFTIRNDSQNDPNSQRHTLILSRRHSDASPQFRGVDIGPSSPFDPNYPMPSPAVIQKSRAITPDMFDDLTFKPACDHQTVVRYGESGGIRAATPGRLVAEITSPTIVDYDLLSDFFLTFRSFLDTNDLLLMLVSRLQWAVARNDEIGTVVRVRTFVAIRHWVLNYFLDDFVIDYELRASFCELLNTFAKTLMEGEMQTKIPLKIVEELKKCWRRVCALYWDGPDFDPDLGVEAPIVPGGVAGSRDPTLDPSFWETQPRGPPRLDGIIEPDFVKSDSSSIGDGHNFFADVSRAGHIDSILVRPYTAAQTSQYDEDETDRPLSPTSITSEDFVSCSFPSRGRGAGNIHPLAAHPVPASSIYDPAPPIATTPRALTGKRVRPAHSHKRSASFSDSLRDRRAQAEPAKPVQKVIYKSTELFLALPYAGSLVRGNLFPPGQAFVDAVAPTTPAEFNGETTLFPRATHHKDPSAMSGPGMKKLLSSVRRALSTRAGPNPTSSPTQGSFPHIPPLGVRGVTINRLPGTAVVPQARNRNSSVRAPMRIDLLGAEVAEDFKKAVQEEEADARQSKIIEQQSPRSSRRQSAMHYSTMCPDVTVDQSSAMTYTSPKSEVTNGSKSIVIVDDTMTLGLPVMTGALAASPSVDTFTDAFMHVSGGPTPPMTPPGITMGTPRRSSHLLGHTVNRSLSLQEIPSLIGDSPLSHDEKCPPSERAMPRHSLRFQHQSYRVRKSLSLRRYASYHSGFTQHRSERSFDATTYTEEQSIADRFSRGAPLPLPLRVLRRRPGGNLRAVNTIEDLHNPALRRPMSTGSLTTYSDSVRSSYLLGSGDDSRYVNVVNSDYDETQARVDTFSLGALATAAPKTRVSLFDTHSSQPVMRPSFEKEAQMLAQIPDDDDDDGGVESALLKLEGKFEQRRSQNSAGRSSLDARNCANRNSFGQGPFDVSTLTLDDDNEEEEKRNHRQRRIVDSDISNLPSASYRPTGMSLPPSLAPQSSRLTESLDEGSFIDAGYSGDESYRGLNRDWSERSILRGTDKDYHRTGQHTPESSHPSFDFITETESLRRIAAGATRLRHESGNKSFLDTDSASDLSSELSLDVISKADYTEDISTLDGQAFASATNEGNLSCRPSRDPPSPPITLVQALKLTPTTTNIPQVHGHQSSQGNDRLPPTPDITPTTALGSSGFGRDQGLAPPIDPSRSRGVSGASRKTSVHLPFILAFDSRVLAQQFTLIEKDALNEIDWKDLIEMRWRDAATDTRSWVEFLRTSEPRGVEVVIARFNIMVKWAVSEIVLTADLEERVRCIIKFIHIAAHCRKYRNFATMTQLTVALTSKDISRLTFTWAHVPASDIHTLNQMEELVTPTSNFHNLRAEMEGSGADQGCIPFVGIYTHDLIVNSERPSHIASTPTTEPLVNFERCRSDATIIKNLLRLLEASQLYRFLPIEGITERCLWMAALRDEDIAKYGKEIQE
ncbi:Guanine nucleotide exchange factor lte1 [Clarireedia jacksonii]